MVDDGAKASVTTMTIITSIMIFINLGTTAYLGVLYLRALMRRHAERVRRASFAILRRLPGAKSPFTAAATTGAPATRGHQIAQLQTTASAAGSTMPVPRILYLPVEATPLATSIDSDDGAPFSPCATSRATIAGPEDRKSFAATSMRLSEP